MRLKIFLEKDASTADRTRDLQIFSLTLSQLSYRGEGRGQYGDRTRDIRVISTTL